MVVIVVVSVVIVVNCGSFRYKPLLDVGLLNIADARVGNVTWLLDPLGMMGALALSGGGALACRVLLLLLLSSSNFTPVVVIFVPTLILIIIFIKVGYNHSYLKK